MNSQHQLLTETAAELIDNVPYFSSQAPQVISALAGAASGSHYPAGSIIFIEGNPVAGLFIIEQGTVKISRMSKDGREHILHMVHSGDTFNDVAVLDGGENPATATAFTDASIWRITRLDLRRVAEIYPSVAWSLAESIARRARFLVGVIEDLAMRNVRGRLAHLLLDEAEMLQDREVPRLMTHEEMASRLGTVREVVGRTLRSMAAEGLIEIDRHRIVLLDIERLREEAEA